MKSRRAFLQTAAAAVVSRSVLGANDRIQMGIIGTGSRGMSVVRRFVMNEDCVFIAACDVAKTKLNAAATKIGGKVDTYGDYRRMLERKDIDAVLIATPDHWHSPMTVDACAAGKDVYVEKPLSNTIPAAQRMLAAVRESKQVVQVGTQQRSWDHFQECAKMVHDGLIGQVTHAVIAQGGGRMVESGTAQQPPADLDWEMWQGPAPRHEYQPGRYSHWRAYYAYGGGLITDWGVHHIDVVNWYLNARAPLLTAATAQYVLGQDPEHDQVPNAFSCSWQYDMFVMSFTNAAVDKQAEGNYFYGTQGVMHVNRFGYSVTPVQPRRKAAGGQPPPLPFQARNYELKDGMNLDSGTLPHTRNFLDCIKSRNKPVCDVETGFHATLPSLIALLAIQQGQSFTWNGDAAEPVSGGRSRQTG
ncbi:MAG: Gfo/Idh/MocA family protein [Bryobacteraceae bacterium]